MWSRSTNPGAESEQKALRFRTLFDYSPQIKVFVSEELNLSNPLKMLPPHYSALHTAVKINRLLLTTLNHLESIIELLKSFT